MLTYDTPALRQTGSRNLTVKNASHDMGYLYRKSGNFGHGFILAPKYEVPKLNTLETKMAKISHTKIKQTLFWR